MRVSVQIKRLQDALSFAMGARGEHVGMGAFHAHFPPQQPQHPGQSSAAQCCHFDTIPTGCHDDGRKQRETNGHEPHDKNVKKARRPKREKNKNKITEFCKPVKSSSRAPWRHNVCKAVDIQRFTLSCTRFFYDIKSVFPMNKATIKLAQSRENTEPSNE